MNYSLVGLELVFSFRRFVVSFKRLSVSFKRVDLVVDEPDFIFIYQGLYHCHGRRGSVVTSTPG